MKRIKQVGLSLRRFPFVVSHSVFLQTYENDSLKLASKEKSEGREEGKERSPKEPRMTVSVHRVRMAMKGRYPA